MFLPYKFPNGSINFPNSFLKNFYISLVETNAEAQLVQEKTKQIENANLRTGEKIKSRRETAEQKIQLETRPKETKEEKKQPAALGLKKEVDETTFLNKAITPEKPQIIDGIDYSNLSIQDALKRMLEVNPNLKIVSLLADRASLKIKQTKREVWLPTVTVVGNALTPVDLISDKNGNNGIYTRGRLRILFALDFDAWDRINKTKASYEVELAKIKEATTEELRNLIETYLKLALSQETFKICQESFKEAKAQLKQIKKDSKYSELEILQAEHFLARIFKKNLVAYRNLKAAQRELKALLDLQEQEDLIIRVADLPQTIEQARKLVEEANLRQPEYRIEVMKKKLEEAKLAEKIEPQPRIKVIASLAGTFSQDTEKTQTTTWATSILEADVFINDFGLSSNLKEEKHIAKQISLLELLKEEKDLKNLDIKRNFKLINLKKKTQVIRDYIAEINKTLNLLRERVELPINILLKRNDQLIETRHLLKETLRDYTFTLSKMSDRKVSLERTLPDYQGLTFEDILTLAEKNQTIEERIAKKRIELKENSLRAAKMSNNPALCGSLSIENASYTDGASVDTTKANISLNGRFFNKKLKYTIDAARASLKYATNQAKVLNNEKYLGLITNYLKAIQMKRRITILKQIVNLRNQTIEEMLKNMEGEFPKYTKTEVQLLILEQLKLNLALTECEFELFTAKLNIKKWTGIPLTENISLKKTTLFDTEEGIKDFLDIIRRRILPFYDAEASVKSALNIVDEYKAKEVRATAFEGISWQIMAEARGNELNGWLDPDTQIGISFSFPFWGKEEREIDKYDKTENKLKSQLNYIKAQNELQKLRAQISAQYETSKAIVNELKKERENLKTQLKTIELLVNMQLKRRKALREAKMRLLFSQLDYEDKLQAYLCASAKRMLILKIDDELPQKNNKFILTNLQDAIELALKNRKEVQIYQDLLNTERNILHYYKRFNPKGKIIGHYIKENIKENSDKSQEIEPLIALANLDVNLINNFVREKQEKKIKLAEMDLERAKFKVILEVVQAYIDYLQATATLATLNERYLKEEEILNNIAEKLKIGIATRMDYLRQEQIVSMLRQKLLTIRKDCTNFKNYLAIVIGVSDPDFLVMDLEVHDKGRQLIIPVGVKDIKQKLLKELWQVQRRLIEPITEEVTQYAKLEIDAAKLELKKAVKKIKSLTITANYVYRIDKLHELSLDESDKLGPFEQSEFFSLSAFCKIYDPETNIESKIKAIDKDITKKMAKKNLIAITQKIQTLFDEYEAEIINYQYAVEKIVKTERAMKTKLKIARKSGNLKVEEEMKIVGMLIESIIDETKIFHEIVNKRCQIDQYLKRYTGCGLNTLAEFGLKKKESSLHSKIKPLNN